MQPYEAIFKRKSVRQYSKTTLTQQELALVEQSIARAKPLYPSLDVQIHFALDGDEVHSTMLGMLGSYGKVRAPHYLVATAVPEGRYLESTGYLLEQVILDLTTAGIGTCWIGAHLNSQPVQSIIDLPVAHVPVLLVAFGHPASTGSVWRKGNGEFKRKQSSTLVFGQMNSSWLDCLEAARLAPSAVNSQPWRFLAEDESVLHVYQAKAGITGKLLQTVNKVDMGIVLSHIMLTYSTNNQLISFEDRPAPAIPGCTYCTSVLRV